MALGKKINLPCTIWQTTLMPKDIIFGIIMSNTLNKTAEWEMVLSAAARMQQIIPDAVMAGGSAAAVYVEHRTLHDDDHLLSDLRHRFDAILTQLESVAGWETRIKAKA
jgi:hypothetical protein